MNDYTVLIYSTCLFVVILIAAYGLSQYTRHRQQTRTRGAWDQLAARTGLLLEQGSQSDLPRLAGEYRGRPAALSTYPHTFTTGNGGQKTITYTLVTVTVQNSASSSLKLNLHGPIAQTLLALGVPVPGDDVQVGDRRFDNRFRVVSRPPGYALSVLGDKTRREGILKLRGRFWVELGGSTLSYHETALQLNVDTLETVFKTLSDFADQIDGIGQSSRF